MTEAGTFLQDLAVVLCVGAVTTILFQWLKQPLVLGYLLAGILLGPHVPISLLANDSTVHTLADLGVILVMFSIGLKFTVEKFVKVLPTAGLTSLIEISLMMWLGSAVAALLGWSPLERLFTGAMLAISSTMISSKALSESN